MKLFIKILVLAFAITAGACGSSPQLTSQETSVNFQLFYNELSPYGSWVDYRGYGYVWIPDVGNEFSPYGSDGHWVFTENGWTWASDYSWGWAPFHYGRWMRDNSYGWLWVPQNEWGPAWVTWRRSEGYYGWAPMEPGITIDVSFGNSYRVPTDRWIFVNERDFDRSDIDQHYVDRSTNITIINNSRVINNTYIDNSRHTTYVSGPDRNDVEKVTRRTIRPVTIRENARPGQTLNNDNLHLYRPRVESNNNAGRRVVPSKLKDLKEVKPVSERRQGNQRRNEYQPSERIEQVPRPSSITPTDNNERNQQPRNINPPDQNKQNEQPLRRENVTPPDNTRRGQQPRDIKPPTNQRRIDQPQQQPRLAPQVEKEKRIDVPKQQRAVKPFDNTRKSQQQRVVPPPVRKRNTDQQAKPKTVRPPNDKRGVPQNDTPPNNDEKKKDGQLMNSNSNE